MEFNEKEWKVVHDADDDNGNPTQWCRKINSELHGRFLWIDEMDENKYLISSENCMSGFKECKSLSSAKRWVTMNLHRFYD